MPRLRRTIDEINRLDNDQRPSSIRRVSRCQRHPRQSSPIQHRGTSRSRRRSQETLREIGRLLGIIEDVNFNANVSHFCHHIDRICPQLLSKLSPLPDQNFFESMQHLCVLSTEKGATTAVRLAQAIRRFEVADSLLTVTKCEVCHGVWMQDFEDEKEWLVEKCLYCCSCGSRHLTLEPDSCPCFTEEEHVDACKQCKSAVVKNIVPPFSKANLTYYSSVPVELQGLTYAEEAAVSRISVIMYCKKLKSGVRSLSGNLSFLYQEQEEMMNVLPRHPSTLSILVFKRKDVNGNVRNKFLVRRAKILEALRYLIRFSPAYRGVSLSEEMAQLWPVNSFLTFEKTDDVGEFECLVPSLSQIAEVVQEEDTIEENLGPSDMGPCPQQQVDYERTEGVTTSERFRHLRLRERGQESVRSLLTAHESGNEVQTTMTAEHCDYEKFPYFFSSAFPTLFVVDRDLPHPSFQSCCEVPSEYRIDSGRSTSFTFTDYVKFLYRCPDSRFASHETLRFALLNLKQKTMMLSQTNIAVRGELAVCSVDREMLVRYAGESVEENAEEEQSWNGDIHGRSEQQNRQEANGERILRRITAHAANVQGTSPYWFKKKQEFAQFIDHKLSVDDDLPSVFHSGSFAEGYCPRAKQVVRRYLEMTGMPSFETDADFFQLLPKVTHVLNVYFERRTRKWFKYVLQEGLGVTDYLLRFEFAPSRGMLHYHSLLYTSWGSSMHEILDPCLDSSNLVELQEKEKEAALRLELFLGEVMHLTSIHPSGRENINFTLFSSDYSPELDFSIVPCSEECFTKHVQGRNVHGIPETEGLLSVDESSVLCKNFFQVPCTEANLVKDLTHLANRTMLHNCSSRYCLKKVNRKKTCRFGFESRTEVTYRRGKRIEVTNTIGKDDVTEPSLSCEGLARLAMTRNHPRLVHLPLLLLSGYRANLDFTPILAAKADLPCDQQRDTMFERELLKRAYVNKDEQVIQTINYLVSYACKTETSYSEICALFRSAILNSSETATLSSIAAKLGMSILRGRVVPGPEADFQNLAQPYTISSRTPVHIWLDGRRLLPTTNVSSENCTRIPLKNTPWDKYIKRPNTLSTLCFNDFVVDVLFRPVNGKKRYPVYANIPEVFQWPLQDTLMNMLLLKEKPYLRTTTDILASLTSLKSREVNGEELLDVFETVGEAFNEFIRSEHASSGLKHKVNRAKNRAENNIRLSEIGPVEGTQESSQEDSLASVFAAGSIASAQEDILNEDFEQLDCSYNWNMSLVGSCEDIEADVKRWEANLEASDCEIQLPSFSTDVNPGSAFGEQIEVLCYVLETLRSTFAGESLMRRLHIQGLAGAGKSFCIDCVRFFTFVLFGDTITKAPFLLIGCPTGCAAFNVGGRTIHGLLGVDTSDKFEPKNTEEKQELFKNVKAFIIDEKSMLGLRLLANTGRVCDAAFSKGSSIGMFGKLPLVLLVGDCLQLSPVLDSPLYSNPGTLQKNQEGKAIYEHLTEDVLFLERSRRQQDSSSLSRFLTEIREGSVSEESVEVVVRRQYNCLTTEEKALFSSESTIHAFATKLEAQRENRRYLKRFPNVHNKAQKAVGSHARSDEQRLLGRARAIPLRLLIAKGCIVRLNKNLFHPNGVLWGLYNGAMGTVKEVVYTGDANVQEDMPAWIIVHFSHYRGPQFFPHVPEAVNWIPIAPIQIRCDKKCCYREGFPLQVEKGKTIHSFQGLTVGEGQQISKIIVHINEEMEKKCPNLHYTAFSRVKKWEDLAIVSKSSLNRSFLKSLGCSTANEQQRAEIERLRVKSRETKEKLGQGNRVEQYSELLSWLQQVSSQRNHRSYQSYVEDVFQYIISSISRLS